MADVQPAGVSAVEFLKPYGRGCLAIQLAAQYFCDLAWVGLTFGGLHHLTYQGIKGPIAAGMVLLNNFRVGGNGLIDHGFNGTTVADLLVTALFNDAIGVTLFLALPHGGKYFARHVIRDGVVCNTTNQSGQLLGADGGLVDALLGTIEYCRQIGEDPVRNQFGLFAP